MDLKEFTKQTLLQIVEGTNEANDAIEGIGAFIPYTNVSGNGKKIWAYDDQGAPRYVLEVNFDVAIAATETEGKNGGASLRGASLISLDAGAESTVANQVVSRVKYTLPLALAKK